MTSLGLQYAIEKHILLDLNIDLHAPLVIIPSEGKFIEQANVLLVNLGRLKIFTHGKRSSAFEVRKLYEQGKDQKDIFEFMKKNCYDNFRVELSDLQILIAESNENWLTTLSDSVTSDMHLLSPLTLSINYSKCLIVDDPRLPLSIITGELPSISIIFSKARLILLVALMASIDFSGKDIPQPQPLSKAKGSSRMLLKYKELQDTAAKQTKRLLNTLPSESTKKEVIQLTTLQMKFIMSEFALKINNQEIIGGQSTEFVSFEVNSLECGLIQQTYVTHVSLLIGSIGLQLHRHEQVIEIIKTPSSGKVKECLFKAIYFQVNEKCPELHSTYKSCESCLSLNFEILYILLHQEGLLSVIRFTTDIQDEVNLLTQSSHKNRIVSAKSDKQLFSTSEHLIGQKKKARRKLPVVVATIKFKLMVILKEVEIKFGTDTSYISSWAIRGIDTTVVVKDTYTQINSILQEISIMDLNPSTLHKLILSGTEGVALTTQIVFNNSTVKSDISDMDVVVKLGEMRIVFLNWFVLNMLNFLNQFQAAQQKIIEASQAAAQTAKENMKEVYTKATKVSLNINLKAPIILFPVDSQNYNCLLLDMGVITLSNAFLNLDVENEEHPVVVDDLKITLTDLKVSRIKLNEEYQTITESSLLKPLSFNIAIKRNLSTWYTSIPDITVFGKIEMIEISH
nr:vacuolar protein sorting-associated protein 13-like [Leptinotarsa decemlineata]